MAHKLMQSHNIVNVPHLDVDEFDNWKDRIIGYLDSIDERLMQCVLKGPIIPLKVSTSTRVIEPLLDGNEPELVTTDTVIPKPREEWTDEDKFTASLDKKAKYILGSALDEKLYKQIKRCKTAQEVMDKTSQLL